MLHLPSQQKVTIVVKFSPVLYELRKVPKVNLQGKLQTHLSILWYRLYSEIQEVHLFWMWCMTVCYSDLFSNIFIWIIENICVFNFLILKFFFFVGRGLKNKGFSNLFIFKDDKRICISLIVIQYMLKMLRFIYLILIADKENNNLKEWEKYETLFRCVWSVFSRTIILAGVAQEKCSGVQHKTIIK